jgi:hypothetical protein
MATLADDLLPACSVQVRIAGKPFGTGFFVAPGQVVTCAHVLASYRAAPDGQKPSLTIVPLTGAEHVVHSPRLWEEDDLALLTLADWDEHPCVLLDPAVNARDQLQAYGFPERYEESGMPASLEAEGAMGTSGWVKLRGSQLRPGMSGGPALNLRTGAVCSIVKRTVDKTQALGGYALSVAKLLEREPTISERNKRFHGVHRGWFDLLTIEQRHLVGTLPRPELDPVRFDVEVRQADDGWEVRATVGPEAQEIGPVPVDLNAVRVQVARLFRNWVVRGRVAPLDQTRLLGDILYRALFRGVVGNKYEALEHTRKSRPVDVSLRFGAGTDPDLVLLPWEHLFAAKGRDGRLGTFLASDKQLSFTRALEPDAGGDEEEPPRRRLAVLLVTVRPRFLRGANGASADAEVETIVRALETPRDGVDIVAVPAPDSAALPAQAIEQLVEQNDWDVVHYVGVGRYERETDELALASGRVQEGLEYFQPETFAECVQGRPPRLVVLQTCDGSPDVPPADAMAFAEPLLDRGVGAVLAYQHPVSAELSQDFNEKLYAALAAGKRVATAVQEGRSTLKLAGDARAFVSPALLVRRPAPFSLVSPARESSGRQDRLAGYV